MPIPVGIVAALPSVIDLGGKLIEALFDDEEKAAEAKLKLVELYQQGRLAELQGQLQEMQVEAADRASAREREQKTGDSRTPQALAALFTLGFFGVMGWLLVAGAPQHGSEALLVLLGALSAGQAAILSYYFGSSSGSAAKTETIARLTGGHS